MTPLDIIAAALDHAGWSVSADDARAQAEIATHALLDERVVNHAVQALKDDGWEQTHEGPNGIGDLSDADLANIARTVLRAIGGQ